MNKSFRSIDDQIRILNARGVSTTPETHTILMREGYYAVVNGYKLPFIDVRASERAEDDRFLPDTSFDDVYALFRFDRDLRALVFRHVMTVEATMRSILSSRVVLPVNSSSWWRSVGSTGVMDTRPAPTKTNSVGLPSSEQAGYITPPSRATVAARSDSLSPDTGIS